MVFSRPYFLFICGTTVLRCHIAMITVRRYRAQWISSNSVFFLDQAPSGLCDPGTTAWNGSDPLGMGLGPHSPDDAYDKLPDASETVTGFSKKVSSNITESLDRKKRVAVSSLSFLLPQFSPTRFIHLTIGHHTNLLRFDSFLGISRSSGYVCIIQVDRKSC